MQFNIETVELLTVHDELQAWRVDIGQPVQLDIYVDTTSSPAAVREALGVGADEPPLALLERWRLHYEPLGSPPSHMAWPAFYKRFMVLLRGLIARLCLLPAHRLASHVLTRTPAITDPRANSPADSSGGAPPMRFQYAFSLPRSRDRLPPPGLGFAAGAMLYVAWAEVRLISPRRR